MFLPFLICAIAARSAADGADAKTVLLGSRVDLGNPCLTKRGSFSKEKERDTIWINGIVAFSKQSRFAYENGSLILRRFVADDAGNYIWTCDSSYWEKTISLNIYNASDTASKKPIASIGVGWKVLVGVVCADVVLLICACALVNVWRTRRDKGKRYFNNIVFGATLLEYTLSEPPVYYYATSKDSDHLLPPSYSVV